MKRLLSLALLGACACAAPDSDAVLVLRMHLPYVAGDRPLASVQVVRDEEAFAFEDTSWVTPKPYVIDLRKTPEHEVEIAARADHPGESDVNNLRVRVLLCDPKASLPCDRDPQTPALQFLLEHPFYAGQRTEWRVGPASDGWSFHMPDSEIPEKQADFPHMSEPPVVVDECSIAGCVQISDKPGATFQPDPDTGFCRATSHGREHFCEGS
jgi:hypothetical protein